MDGHIVNGVSDYDSNSGSVSACEGLSNGDTGVVEPGVLAEMLTRLDVDLAYSSEKMANLDLFMAIVSLEESDLEELSANNKISEAETEKAFIVDLCVGYLDSEVAELDHFLTVLRTRIYDAKQKTYLCGQRSESLQKKLHALEGSWKHTQEQLSEMKSQLGNLRRTLSIIGPENSCYSDHEELELQTPVQQRSILRMLEKSLASELDFEKRLLESKQREKALKSKLSLTKRFLSNAEAFSEAALEKLLAADSCSEVFMGIAKEMMSRLQVLNFHVHCSVWREDELKLKLECKNKVLSNLEAFSEEALTRLIEAEQSSEIFMSIVREMGSHLQELTSKLSCKSEVASEMEAYSEVALEKALEAEYSSVIFSAIVKEMMSRIQLLEHDLHGSVQKEQDMKSRLVLTNESVSNLEAYLEDALVQLLEAELSDEILIGIVKQMLSYLQLLQSHLHSAVHREQELNSQLLLTNEAVSNLEAFSELALPKLLDAEHRSEIFMGIAREMMSRIQILQFNLQCALLREGDLTSKLQGSLEQLKEKETALTNAEILHAEMKRTFQEKETLMEEKLQVSESKLQETKALYEASQEQVSLMEDAVQSLREHVFMAESRAHESEAKLAALVEENIELREEVGFVKGGDDSGEEKVSKLEKQVRDLETQLQTAKMSSEASQEQQNMLYKAIWDMETLIEELKSKVSKTENRAESSEEQLFVLVETNSELSEEMTRLKAENERLKGSLKEANRKNVTRVKEINNATKLITEMVMQLAAERERIQKQLSYLARENKTLMEELQKTRQNDVKPKQDNKDDDEKESSYVMDDRATSVSASEQSGENPTSTTANNQVEETSEQKMRDRVQPAVCSSSDSEMASDNITTHENQGRSRKGRHPNKMSYTFATLLVLALSILAMSIN